MSHQTPVDSRAAVAGARHVGSRKAAMLVLLLAPALAFGLSSDREQPMDVDAEHGIATLSADGEADLSGNVVIEQGSLKIEADKAHFTRRGGELQRIVFSGAPARMQQHLDAGGMTRVQARRIDYDVPNDVVVLTGAVVVTQPEGSMRGERITYNMQSGQLTGGESGSRIRMRIEPRQPAAD